MPTANKSTIGLGKVINRLQVDGNDIQLLINRVAALEQTKLISGNWDNLVSNNPGYVTSSGNMYTLNLNNNQAVDIALNADAKTIQLTGGLNGRAYYFKFTSVGTFSVGWNNIRVTNGDIPPMTSGTLLVPKVTTLTVCKLGNEYYIIDVNLDVI